MTLYANTLNETFVEVSDKLRRMEFRYYKKILKVTQPELINFPVIEMDRKLINDEIKLNPWFFIRELLLSKPEKEPYFTWKSFVTLELLLSRKSSIVVNNDLSLAMYLRWCSHSNNHQFIIVPDAASKANLIDKTKNLNVDIALQPLINRSYYPMMMSSDLTIDVSFEKSVVVYAKELTNEILSFFLLNKDKTNIIVIVDEDNISQKKNNVIVPEIFDLAEVEFHEFEPSYFHRHIMSNFSIYANLMK